MTRTLCALCQVERNQRDWNVVQSQREAASSIQPARIVRLPVPTTSVPSHSAEDENKEQVLQQSATREAVAQGLRQVIASATASIPSSGNPAVLQQSENAVGLRHIVALQNAGPGGTVTGQGVQVLHQVTNVPSASRLGTPSGLQVSPATERDVKPQDAGRFSHFVPQSVPFVAERTFASNTSAAGVQWRAASNSVVRPATESPTVYSASGLRLNAPAMSDVSRHVISAVIDSTRNAMPAALKNATGKPAPVKTVESAVRHNKQQVQPGGALSLKELIPRPALLSAGGPPVPQATHGTRVPVWAGTKTPDSQLLNSQLQAGGRGVTSRPVFLGGAPVGHNLIATPLASGETRGVPAVLQDETQFAAPLTSQCRTSNSDVGNEMFSANHGAAQSAAGHLDEAALDPIRASALSSGIVVELISEQEAFGEPDHAKHDALPDAPYKSPGCDSDEIVLDHLKM